ncbi:uncharacterized protein LOC123205671 [Mangifera indica]|uniref:uncharacterized protein LOC123205671 n=1 Tax=Mangifera indica TaxID=29780 RepID=UPI001CF95305|nr:uncharacterized protein LOC123205671 [Mangifera indica]
MAMQESILAPAPLDADPYWLPNPNASRSSQSQHPLDDSYIEAQPHSTATAGDNSAEAQISQSLAKAAAHQLRTTANLMYSYLPLYNAAKHGDWKTATSLIGDNRNLWISRMTTSAETVLMVAARSLKWEFVEKLVELLTPDELAMQNIYGDTVLHYVTFSESIKTAELLVRKCSELTQIVSENGATPLLVSLRLSLYKDMIWYLALVTRLQLNSPTCPFTGTLSTELFCNLTYSGFNDITLYLLRQYHEYVGYPLDQTGHLLLWLSAVPSNVHINKNSLTFIERWLYKFIHVEMGVPPHSLRNKEGVSSLTLPEPSRSFLSQELHCLKMLLWKASEKVVPSLKRVREAKLQQRCVEEIVEKFCIEFGSNFTFDRVSFILLPVMYSATRLGNVEIVRICLKHFPDLIFGREEPGNRHLLLVATECRQEEIFNLITEIPITRAFLANSKDNYGNTVWHSSAKLAPSSKLLSVSGAALQMQRELQWFKEVEELIDPAKRRLMNMEGKTAMEIFMEDHKKLAEEGEKWMKDTANSCMIVTTLIATVVFAAAFTVPGGNVGDTGIPDALALFSSFTSFFCSGRIS